MSLRSSFLQEHTKKSKMIKRARRDSSSDTASSSTHTLSDTSNSHTNELQIRRSQRIQNSLLQDDKVDIREDPVSILLPEILAEVYKYCSNSDLCRFRLVSSAWKNSVKEVWRKRVTIYIYKGDTVGSKRTSSLKEFSEAIQNEQFDFANRPLTRIKFFKFEFVLQNYNARSVSGGLLNFCGSTVSHLEISDCIIKDGRQFSHNFLSKFSNIRTLILTRLLELPQNTAKKNKNSDGGDNGTENFMLPVFENLSHLKIDYSGIDYTHTDSTKLFQPPWLVLLSSMPNLETLDVFDGKAIEGSMGFKIIDVLQPIAMLSLENKLKKLKHIHILNQMMYVSNEVYHTFKRSLVEQSEALQRSSISLKSLKFDAYVDLFLASDMDLVRDPSGNEIMETLLQKFGTRDLQNLGFSTWKSDYPQFPPAIKGMSLENLNHLSLHSTSGKTIKSAEQMPNLKSLEIWSIPPHTRERNELERNNIYLKYLPADHIPLELADEEDGSSNDPDYIPGDILSHDDKMELEVAQPIILNNPDDNLPENNYEAMFWEIANPNAAIGVEFKFLTHFRFEGKSILRDKFHSLSTWMPNLTSLEIPLTASDFTTVCGQLRSLRRLVLLYTPIHYEMISSSPIDDCAITGKRHTSNTLFVCSCNNFVPRHRRKQSVNSSYFCDIGQPAVKPNITCLPELQHFEMKGLRMRTNLDPKFRMAVPENGEISFIYSSHRAYDRNIYLTDESVFDGFFKLPKLTYLNVSAKLSNYTRKELFRRISKCIIQWPVEEESYEVYFTMQNFEPDNVA